MIGIDALWLCAQPVDMRAGPERLLAAVVTTLGQARAHHGYRDFETAVGAGQTCQLGRSVEGHDVEAKFGKGLGIAT